ncbi:MAG: prenyltransferase, partial [Candidatus Thermoplasmatota archaeon]
APPLRLSYRGVGEFPHFIAGLMNAGWGYILITGTIDIHLLIFAIPFSLHLLNVILIFEIPDREADIHGGKRNLIVKYGRKKSFLLISIIFWLATIYFSILAIFGWNKSYINFWILTLFSFIPSVVSTLFYLRKSLSEKDKATKLAIRTAMSLFAFSIISLLYFIYLQL